MKRKVNVFMRILTIFICFFVGRTYAIELRVLDVKTIDGIVYKMIERIGVVVGRGSKPYEGDIVVPERVEFNGVEQIVNGILPDAFCCSPHLKSVEIRCKVRGLQDGQFYRCYNLNRVELPETLVRIGEYSFEDCHNLENIELPENVVSIGDYAFSSCYSLSKIDFPQNADFLGKNVCSNCYNLREVILPNLIDSIKENSFADCIKLSSIQFGRNTKTIEELAFYNCKSLETLILPDALEKINDKAFKNCLLIDDLVFPESIKFIGWDTFCNCNEMKRLSFAGEMPPKMGESPFYYHKGWGEPRPLDVLVPDGYEEIYKRALRWKAKGSDVKIKSFTLANMEVNGEGYVSN